MKVLWICNIVLPELADIFGFKKVSVGGWLTGMWAELKKRSDLSLAICVPVFNPNRQKDGKNDGYNYYSFLVISNESQTRVEDQVIRFKEIINDFNPDVIHVWGTEYEHNYALVKAADELGLLDKVLVNIQGLLTYYSRVYRIGIHDNRFFKKDEKGFSIADGLVSFHNRAEYEQEIIKSVKNCIGRTDWDKACATQMNNQINYFYCGEILRKSFYLANKWSYEKCRKHSIYISQASYPIKGLHLVLDELVLLREQYDDLEIRIAGDNLMESDNPYAVYIQNEIYKKKLEETICFLGNLSEEQVVEQYLNTHVFLSASLIENSSNSICEAMLLGVPVVASDVGGTSSLIDHKKGGFLYPLMEPNMMRYYISYVFDNEECANKISEESIKRAEAFNNKVEARNNLLSIYRYIGNR